MRGGAARKGVAIKNPDHMPDTRRHAAVQITEYADTAFMILRKKQSQVTLLHVAHHAEMGPLMLLFCRVAPGGASSFGPMINSGIHAFMYTYYALTALGYKPRWKQSLTAAQLVQFVVILVQACYHIYTGGHEWSLLLAVAQLLLMIQVRACIDATIRHEVMRYWRRMRAHRLSASHKEHDEVCTQPSPLMSMFYHVLFRCCCSSATSSGRRMVPPQQSVGKRRKTSSTHVRLAMNRSVRVGLTFGI